MSTATVQPKPDKPVFLTMKQDLELAVGEQPVARQGLGAALDRATEGKKETRVFLRADRVVPYGEVVNVMNLLRARGYLKVALVGLEAVEPTDNAVPAPP